VDKNGSRKEEGLRDPASRVEQEKAGMGRSGNRSRSELEATEIGLEYAGLGPQRHDNPAAQLDIRKDETRSADL
jgi:hypothetical protein